MSDATSSITLKLTRPGVDLTLPPLNVRTRPAFNVMGVILFFVGLISMSHGIVSFQPAVSSPWLPLILVGCMGYLVVFLFVVLPRSHTKAVRAAAEEKSMILELRPDGLTVIYPRYQRSYAWRKIFKFTASVRFVALHKSRRERGEVFMKDWFSSQNDFELFKAYVQSHVPQMER